MTTEDEFQALLDANPEDHHTRLVFADWLQEQADPRAEGYRAIARLPQPNSGSCPSYLIEMRHFLWMRPTCEQGGEFAVLADDWFGLLAGGFQLYSDGTVVGNSGGSGQWRNYSSRREAEDAAALAFAKLPAKRRAALLAGKGAEPKAAKRKKKPKTTKPKKKPKPKRKKK